MCLTGLVTIYLVVDFFEELRKFLGYDAELSTMLVYFFYRIPVISFEIAPLAALMATLLTIGILNKNQEITAMRSCGISLHQTTAPFLAFGLVVTLLLFSFTAVIIPLSNSRADYVKTVLIKKKPHLLSLKADHLWLRIPNKGIMNVGTVERDGTAMRTISLYSLNSEFQLIEITEAKTVQYTAQGWTLDTVTQRTVFPNGTVTVAAYPSLPLDLSLSPEDLRVWFSLDPENMTLKQLRAHIDRLERDGHSIAQFLTDYWGRIAFSSASLMMTILGIALGLRQTGTRSTSMVMGIGQALVIGLLYWAAHNLGIALGRGGAMIPFGAGWIATFMFLSISLNLFLKVRH